MPEKWDLERERAFKKNPKAGEPGDGALDRAEFALKLIKEDFVQAMKDDVGYDMMQNVVRAMKELEQAKDEATNQSTTHKIYEMEEEIKKILDRAFTDLLDAARRGRYAQKGNPGHGNPSPLRDEYHLNTQTGELCNAYSQSLTGFRRRATNQGYTWTEVIVRISKKVYDMLNPSGQITTKYHDE